MITGITRAGIAAPVCSKAPSPSRLRVVRSVDGASTTAPLSFRSSLRSAHRKLTATIVTSSSNPALRPARNMSLIDTLAATPYTTIGMLGGMRIPSRPATETRPPTYLRGYPRFTISGVMIEPIAETVATDDPEMAPKMAEAPRSVAPMPPLSRPVKMATKPTRRRDTPPSCITTPPSRKNGIASSGKESMVR